MISELFHCSAKNIKVTLVLAIFIVQSTSIRFHHQIQLTKHSQIDLNPYISGRTLTINKCFNVFDDNTTIFTFQLNHQIVIQSCNTHQCNYQLVEYSFTVSQCLTQTTNDCPNDPGDVYVNRFLQTKLIILQANLITFTDAQGAVTLQLSDKK